MNPLSAIFGSAVAFRNRLYDRQSLKIHRLTRPVVSVGNISVGGSGKTPFVIALGELLKERGIAFDVLSRGYGRRSKDIVVVNPEGTPEEFGDEPLLIARKLRVPVVVGADRYRAGLLAEKSFPSKIHVLDDGFQHRRLHRDFDIVLLRPEDRNDTLLPIGRLREPLASLKRASAVVVPQDVPAPELQDKPVWRASRHVDLPDANGTMVAFCGIARPEQFFAAVERAGARVVAKNTFPDHHRYREADIARLLRIKAESHAEAFVTTEKDLVNLGPIASKLQPIRAAELRLLLENPEQRIAELLYSLKLQ